VSGSVDSESPAPLRYYLDEHLPPVIAERLRARAVTDEEQLVFAAADERTLVTSDRDFVALSVTSAPHAGIDLLQNQLGIGQTVTFLELFAGVTAPEEMRDQIRFCEW
jgi:Domain of unknown function (DUF5615)